MVQNDGSRPHRRQPTPPLAVRERVHALWDALADRGSAQSDEGLRLLLNAVAELTGAANAYWLGTVRLIRDERDGLRGWRPRVVRYLRPTPADDAHARRSIQAFARGEFDESAVAHARQAGQFRAPLIRELVSPGWFKSRMGRQVLRDRGYSDMLFVISPINASAESYFGFLRAAPGRFRNADRVVASYAIRGLKWFQRHLMLSHGLLVAQASLSPAEQRVLRLLLTEVGEKEIAARLGLTLATTHGYVTSLLRKFGVSGRAGLTALWLGGTEMGVVKPAGEG